MAAFLALTRPTRHALKERPVCAFKVHKSPHRAQRTPTPTGRANQKSAPKPSGTPLPLAREPEGPSTYQPLCAPRRMDCQGGSNLQLARFILNPKIKFGLKATPYSISQLEEPCAPRRMGCFIGAPPPRAAPNVMSSARTYSSQAYHLLSF